MHCGRHSHLQQHTQTRAQLLRMRPTGIGEISRHSWAVKVQFLSAESGIRSSRRILGRQRAG